MIDYVRISLNGDEAALKQIIADYGPVSVAYQVNWNSQFYSSGVLVDNVCTKSTNHAVTLVGYGTLDGIDYYIIKNSWGTNYGMDGYALFGRNNNNQCGIAGFASYPIIDLVGASLINY